MNKRIHCFVLSELNVFYAAALLFVGRKVMVIDRNPLLPGGDWFLGRVTARLRRSPRFVDIRQEIPATERFWELGGEPENGAFFDWVETTAAAQDEYFAKRRFDILVPEYDLGIKAVIANHLSRHVFLIYMLRDLERDGRSFVVHGLEPEILSLYQARWNAAPTVCHSKTIQFRVLLNLLYAIAGIVFNLALLIRRYRPAAPKPISLYMAADTPEPGRTVTLVDEITVGVDAPVMHVARNNAVLTQLRIQRPNHMSCGRNEGVVDTAMLVSCLRVGIVDPMRIWFACRHLQPSMTRAAQGLPHWRIIYRAMFRRFHPQWFWARDDYTPEHHMRSQEMRRIGGKSAAIMHGLPWAAPHGGWQFIDFEHYFVFGRNNMGEILRRHWPSHMNVRAVGSWAMSRQDWAQLSQIDDRSTDIAVMASDAPGGLEATVAVRTIAEAFPERKIYFRTKKNSYPSRPDLDIATKDIIENKPENVVIETDKSYTYFKKFRYAFSSPSSIVAESLQFDVMAFCLLTGFEGYPEPRPLIYKRYPFLCVRSAEEFIERVRMIEAGQWHYPRQEADDLIEPLKNGQTFDVIRADLGLPPIGGTP